MNDSTNISLNQIIPLLVVISVFYLFYGCQNDTGSEISPPDDGEDPTNEPYPYEVLEKWQPGYFDIHHINTGRGDATFMIFPDGTTLLYDAGEIGVLEDGPYPIHPNRTKSAGEWIAYYIQQLMPEERETAIDYAIISHFHHDHYGGVLSSSPDSENGDYKLTGLVAVGDVVPIKTMIDRAYPDYDFPKDLRAYYAPDAGFMNYLDFLTYQVAENGMNVTQPVVGSTNQITEQFDPNKFGEFNVRVIKSNDEMWMGEEKQTVRFSFDPDLINPSNGKFNENPLSIVLRFSYGAFDYYTGGDLPGFNDWPDFNMESQLAEVIGEVEVMTLNHHGYKDANNRDFLLALSPQVVIHQTSHDPHYQGSVLERLQEISPDVFTTNMSQSTINEFGSLVDGLYRNEGGHILIRVLPGGGSFDVYELDDDDERMGVRQKIGNYAAE